MGIPTLVSFPRLGDTGRVAAKLPGPVEPNEQIAAIVTGWFVAWAMMQLTVPAVPALMAGIIIWAFVRGGYRRRWTPPAAGPTR